MVVQYAFGGTTCSDANAAHCWDDTIHHYIDAYEPTSWTNLLITYPSDATDSIDNILDYDVYTSFAMSGWSL